MDPPVRLSYPETLDQTTQYIRVLGPALHHQFIHLAPARHYEGSATVADPGIRPDPDTVFKIAGSVFLNG